MKVYVPNDILSDNKNLLHLLDFINRESLRLRKDYARAYGITIFDTKVEVTPTDRPNVISVVAKRLED